MLALCLMLLATYYAQNYAGIISWSLIMEFTEIKTLARSCMYPLYVIAYNRIGLSLTFDKLSHLYRSVLYVLLESISRMLG